MSGKSSDGGTDRGSENRRLSSWKQIARYLGRDPRTVMRWEKQAGLPVHRVPSPGGSGSVYAFSQELDAWLTDGRARSSGDLDASGDVPETARRSRRGMIVGLLGVGLTAAGIAVVASSRAQADAQEETVSRLEGVGNVVTAWYTDGRQAWSVRHPGGLRIHPQGQMTRRVDLDGDGSGEVLLATNTSEDRDGAAGKGELLAFSAAGEFLWGATHDDDLTFGAGTFDGPWVLAATEVLSVRGTPTPFWAVHDHTWWPAILTRLDAEGNVRGRFVNSGWILAIASFQGGAGDVVLAGGISNARGGAMLAVLDPDALDGASPDPPYGPYACRNCPPGTPLRYLVFPPSDVNQASGLPYNQTVGIEATEEGFKVIVLEGPPGSTVHWVYEFSRDLELLEDAPSDSYWPTHRLLRLDGYIDHDEEACPLRQARTIHLWTPAAGWTEIDIGVAQPAS